MPPNVGETTGLADVFGNAGLAVEELPAGDLDGGDVLKIGSTAYVGMGGRTNAAGVEALASVIGPRGWDVRPILVTKVLHLKSAVTALPDGTVIGYPPLIDDQTLFPGFFEVPEEHGGHVVLVADDTVLMSTSAPRTAEMLQARPYDRVCRHLGIRAPRRLCDMPLCSGTPVSLISWHSPIRLLRP